MEVAYDRGWTDGLPIPTAQTSRSLRMLDWHQRRAGRDRGPDPAESCPVTVEKAAVNAVMAGCPPEYYALAARRD